MKKLLAIGLTLALVAFAGWRSSERMRGVTVYSNVGGEVLEICRAEGGFTTEADVARGRTRAAGAARHSGRPRLRAAVLEMVQAHAHEF